MINKEKLADAIKTYKNYFPVHWEDEKYKWEAVKCFQDNWDINATDFEEMFNKATDVKITGNLLSATAYWQPRAMIKHFCEICGNSAVRNLFKDLFDEKNDLRNRIERFIGSFNSPDMIERVNAKMVRNWKSNQDTRAISVYLMLMYPEKYYFYISRCVRQGDFSNQRRYMRSG